MSSLSLKNDTLISLLFALFLISSVNIENGMGISAILMLLVSVAGLIVTRKQDYPSLKTWEKYWLSSLFFFVGLIYIDILRDFGDISDIDSQSRLLLAIPVYLYVRRIGVNLNIVLIGAAIAAIVTGSYAWHQHVELGLGRAHGFTNAIYYGDIVLLLFIFCAYGFLLTKNIWLKILMAVSTLFGLYAVLSSGARGGWIAMPTLIILFISYNIWNIALWKRLLSSVLIVVVLVGAYHSPDLIVKQRLDKAIERVSNYYTDKRMSSVGYRLEMWKASYLSAIDHNFLGAGENSFRPEVKRLAKEGRVHESLHQFVDPHSQYFNALLDQGFLGVISLLLISFIPLKILLSNLKDTNQSHASAILPSAILLVFMEFMLTISALEIQIIAIFYAFSLSIFLGLFTYNRN
jgi:O-antigen ligase